MGGAVLVVFGVLESLGVIPIRPIVSLTLDTHRIDIGALIVGALLVWRGIHILDRPSVGAPKAG
jgi:hypothetical protein